MSLLEVQNFLARIYTDKDLRRAFFAEPEKIGLEAGLSENEIAELKQVLPEELNFFAESLFYKRLREVEKFLPLTKESLGKDFETYFREFAGQFVPTSIKKNYEDAVEFCKFLQPKSLKQNWSKDVVKFEQAAMEFGAGKRRFILKIFDYDLKTKQKRKNFRLWLRIGKRRIIF
jgi:hypothetical protein